MKNEEAITYWEQLKKTFSESRDHTTNELAKEHLQTSIDAIDVALAAIRGNGSEPLTLDQLREMDGQPVWVECLEDQNRSGWRLIFWDRKKYLVILHTSLYGFLLDDYGKTWLAYAYLPAHIDREAWEECESCETCVSCQNSLVPYGENPCKECSFGERECYDPRNFCPDCGRPLTEEAWAELEKRLRGN